MNREIGAAQGVEYGVCRYCGQMKTLAVPMPTQEEADKLATETCSCDPAKAVRRRQREYETIQQMFSGYAPPVLDLLQRVVDLIRDGLLESGTSIKLEENVTAKFKSQNGAVIVTRAEKHQHQTSM